MLFVAVGSLGYLVGRTFLYFYQRDKRINNALKLVKENKYIGSFEIVRGEIPKYDRSFVTKTILEQENEIIRHFLDTMQMQYVPYCYNNFIANLSKIEIIPTSLICKYLKKTEKIDAYVEPDETNDKLKVWFGDNTSDLTKYHELFHVASTVFDEKIKKFVSGFDHSRRNKYFGKGINEGYTDLLTGRYFNQGEPSKSTADYNANIVISYLIEQLIGRIDMENLYYQADLNGLINMMSEFIGTENTMRVISNSDILTQTKKAVKRKTKTKLQEENKELWFKMFNESIKILFNAIVDKQINKYNNNELSLKEVYENIKFLYQKISDYIYDFFEPYLKEDIIHTEYLFNNAMERLSEFKDKRI